MSDALDTDTLTVELTKGDVARIGAMLDVFIRSAPEGDPELLELGAIVDKFRWAMHEQHGVTLDSDPR